MYVKHTVYKVQYVCVVNNYFYGLLIHDNLGEPVVSQRRDLLEQPLNFCEPNVITVAQPIAGVHNIWPAGCIAGSVTHMTCYSTFKKLTHLMFQVHILKIYGSF